jgi:predicted transcriptional regulator
MSKSIRISDELAARADRAARLFHRSPPQQIEHWAQLGRVMETALSFPAQTAAKAAGRKKLDDALAAVGTVRGTRLAHAVISRTAATIEAVD